MLSFEDRLKVIVQQDVQRLVKAQEKYGDSWRKRGGQEAFYNWSRKVDRVEVACEKTNHDIFAAIQATPASDGTFDGKDGLLDDLRELRHYILLIEEFVTRTGGA